MGIHSTSISDGVLPSDIKIHLVNGQQKHYGVAGSYVRSVTNA